MDMQQFIAESEKVCEAASAGPWRVWNGPEFCGGGHDLCIGAGENWLANMDHRAHPNREEAEKDIHEEHAHSSERYECDICSFSAEISKEQWNNAQFIVHARTALPTALQYLRELSQENELLKVHNRELRALAIERDAITRRVAELEGQVRCGWGGGPKP